MNKLILKMPRFVVEKYINEHFSEISESDYFELVNLKINIPINLYNKNPELLKNRNVLLHVIKTQPEILFSNPELIKLLQNSDITPEIVNALIRINYSIDDSDIKDRPSLLCSEQLILNSLRSNPEFLFKLKNIDVAFVSYAVSYGLKVTYEDLLNNPHIRSHPLILSLAYKDDVRSIRFFNKYQLLYEISNDAVNRGYVATEEDLLENPLLCNIARIMEAAINKNPELIKYITNFCGIQLSEDCINKALKNYEITEQDLLNNPELCGVVNIINHYPQYRLYSAFLTEEEKIFEIKNLLFNNDYNALSKLPFFKKELQANISGESASVIAKILMQQIEEDSISQRSFNQIFDFIIDGIVNIRYKKNKEKFLFSDIVSIHKVVLKAFSNEKTFQDEEQLKELADSLYNFINTNVKNKIFIQKEYILSRINDLYALYLTNSKEYEHAATVFYTEILNMHRNVFCSYEKGNIISSIKDNFNLNGRRKRNVYNGQKLRVIENLIADNKYEELKTTKEQINILLNNIELEVKSNKDLNKLGINLTDDILNELRMLFLKNGKLIYSEIANITSISNLEVIQYLFKKYNNLKLYFLDNVNIINTESITESLNKQETRFNFNNFLIADSNRLLENIAKVLLTINQCSVDKIIQNEQTFDEILKIVPFVNVLPELNTETLIHILENYPKVKEKIVNNNAINSNVLARFSDVILLSNGYSVANDLYNYILGIDVIETLGVSYIKEYFGIYLKMQKRYTSEIPAVKGEMFGLTYESGKFNDTERLLIGRHNSGSCIDLINYAGNETYEECLLNNTGDVIILRHKETGDFYARILMFRRGNVIQLAPCVGENGVKYSLDDDFYQSIANQILKKSKEAGDNIDYVFVSENGYNNESKFKTFGDDRFVSEFPHADYTSKTKLIGSSKSIHESLVLNDLDFNVTANAVYYSDRKVCNNINESFINRLKALRIALEVDTDKKEELEKNFEPFYRSEYSKVLYGEDWYIALKKNGQIEELILPTNDNRALIEFEQAKEYFINYQYLSDNINNIKIVK